MDPTFWHDRWKRQDIGFHQQAVHEQLARYWPLLGVSSGSTVFVPLAGKSLDMAWLAGEGHRVIGSELSELAIDAFFSSQGLTPAESYSGLHVVKRAAPYELWLGDIFALPRDATRGIAAVYDRAALIAMPRPLQRDYAEKLILLTPPGASILLAALEYDPSEMSGPPFSVSAEQVEWLFEPACAVTRIETREILGANPHFRARGVSRMLETVYRLKRT